MDFFSEVRASSLLERVELKTAKEKVETGGETEKKLGNVRLITLTKNSWLELHDDAVTCDKASFDSLLTYMLEVQPTPNPMNPNFNLRRRQCTFGAEYTFGAQKSKQMGGLDRKNWPELVNRCLDVAHGFFEKKAKLAVHANLYPDGAGVGAHHDNDGPFDHTKGILSFTFLSDPDRPRNFDIYFQKTLKRKRDEKGIEKLSKAMSLPLKHASLLIMGGSMQTEFLHGIESVKLKKFVNHFRINLTVRQLHD